MSRFLVPKSAVKDRNILVSGKEAHHIIDVMRLKERDKVTTFDGTGKEYTGFIKEIKRKSVLIEIVETRILAPGELLKITLIQAIPKKEKMDYIVEKATELGVSSVIPVMTKRTIPDWDESKRRTNWNRWVRLAEEAAKQCGRADVPLIAQIKTFPESMKVSSGNDLALIAALSDDAARLKDALSGLKGGKITVAIGPEGDFTPDEIACAREAGFKLVNLGSRVLKSDTAGLAVLSILNYEFSK